MNGVLFNIYAESIDEAGALTRSVRSVELIDDAVAGVEGVGSSGHPVLHDDGLVEGPQGNVDVAEAHEVDVHNPADEPDVGEVNCFNLSLHRHSLLSLLPF